MASPRSVPALTGFFRWLKCLGASIRCRSRCRLVQKKVRVQGLEPWTNGLKVASVCTWNPRKDVFCRVKRPAATDGKRPKPLFQVSSGVFQVSSKNFWAVMDEQPERSHPQQSPDPTPAEIRQHCERLQSRWSAGERERRQMLHATAWEVPRASVLDLPSDVTDD